jgi:hypothetical protein
MRMIHVLMALLRYLLLSAFFLLSFCRFRHCYSLELHFCVFLFKFVFVHETTYSFRSLWSSTHTNWNLSCKLVCDRLGMKSGPILKNSLVACGGEMSKRNDRGDGKDGNKTLPRMRVY